MTETPTPFIPSRSQIPVAVNRRHSMNILQQSTNSVNSNASASSSRATSPLLGLGKPPPVSNIGKIVANGGGGKRYSLLPAGNGRKPSFGEGERNDDPTHLKAQIALLQSSLHASHQRIVNLTAELNLNSSTSTSMSAGGLSPALLPNSPGLWSPSEGGLAELPEVDTSFAEENTERDEEDSHVHEKAVVQNGENDTQVRSRPPSASGIYIKPRLPHSSSSYDLRGRAVTPGKEGSPQPETKLGLQRIPQSTVTQNLSLHTNSPAPSPMKPIRPSPTHSQSSPNANIPNDPNNLLSPFLVPGQESPLPNQGRLSPALRSGGGGSAASTRVIDALQTELINARGHLERVKQEVRSGQRLIGSLTRQTEDLKETRERMRVECDSLNNVILRKERLLQEVLERARAAETLSQTLQSNKKQLEQSTKKSISAATAQVSEAQAAQAKAEREAGSLRDSVKSLREVWGREVRSVKEEVKTGEEKWRLEKATAREKHLALAKLVESQASERANIQQLAETAQIQYKIATDAFDVQIKEMKGLMEKSTAETGEARVQAAHLAEELAHLRHLMRKPRREDLIEAANTAVEPEESIITVSSG